MKKNTEQLKSLQEDLENIKEVVKQKEVPHVYQEKYKTILSSLDALLSVEKDVEINKIESNLEEFQSVTKELINLKKIESLADSSNKIEKHLDTLKNNNKNLDKNGSRFKRNRKKLTLWLSLTWWGLVANKYLKWINLDKFKDFFKKFPDKIKKFFAWLWIVWTKVRWRRKDIKSKFKTKQREVFHPKEVIKELENQIEFLKEESTPLRFKILEEKNGYTKVKINFYDRDDKKIKSITKTLKWTGLNFDFLIAPMQVGIKKNNWEITQIPKASLAFPWKIFTDSMKPENGIDIRKEYNNWGFPEIFNDTELSDETKTLLQKQYTTAQSSGQKPDGRIWSSISKTKIDPFKVGTIYKIVSHSKGGLEVVED